MGKVLKEDFFNRDTKVVAQELLGKFLVRKIGNKEIAAMITETEAYDGPHDLASHAAKGKTQRTAVMYGKPAYFYVYLCYGIYHMLNVVTREDGYPAAILIRGVRVDDKGLNGPGKLTRFLGIGKSFNGKEAKPSTGLWFEDRGIQSVAFSIQKLPRVGVKYAGPVWSAKKWRFLLSLQSFYNSKQ